MLTVDKEISSDIAVVDPAEGLRGEIVVPGDKSVSHRAIIMGSIAEGVTEVSGLLEGEDTMSTLRAFEALGVAIERVGPTELRIRGNGMDGLNEPEDVIDAGNSGTTARLLTGLLCAQRFFSAVTGDRSLRSRPMKRVVEPLVKMGASVTGRKDGSLLPLAISGRRLKGISYSTPVASAQLKSALLLAGLYAEGETTVMEPAKSRDHTERMLKLFGAEITVRENSVMVRRAKRLEATRIDVPGDLSSAAFFVVGAIITPGSEVLIKDVGVNPTRTGVIEILHRMGAHVDMLNPREVAGEPVADLSVRSSALRGVEITGAELLPAIDEFPILCVAAALAEGTTVISGAKELRVKESDRVAAMAGSLKALGVNCVEREDGLVIEGSAGRPLSGNPVKSRADHRIAMSMAIAALRTDRGVRIDGAGSVQVSFPGFFSLLDSVRV